MSGTEIRVMDGIPTAIDFASGHGTPIILNELTARAYAYLNETVTPISGESFNAVDFEVTNDGVETGSAMTAFLDMVESFGGTARFPRGTYSYATSPNFARAGVNVIADRGALFRHTGTGQAFLIDGGLPPASPGIFGLTFENITVQGNANSTNGIYVRSLLHSRFHSMRCMGCATTGAGIRIEWGILNEWNSPVVSANAGPLSPLPLHGMRLTQAAVSYGTTTQTIINPIMESLTATGGVGIYFDVAATNTILGGSAEACYDGIVFSNNPVTTGNRLAGMDLEANTHSDITMTDTQLNLIEGTLMASNPGLVLAGTAHNNLFLGGHIFHYSAAAGTYWNRFDGVQFETSFSDASILNEYINNISPSGTAIVTQIRGGLAKGWKQLTYSASIATDAWLGDYFSIVVTNNTALQINNPTHPTLGQCVTYFILNASGGAMGAITWDTEFHLAGAFTNPANGTYRAIEFCYTYYSGFTHWLEKSRLAADAAY